ncbi:MAG: pilin [Candidatus Altiarchaeota archaeon]
MDKKTWILAALNVLLLASYATATDIETTVCDVMKPIMSALGTIGGTLMVIMFTYGGVKYVFASDDPGGRKAGKDTCIHAVIGGVILIVATTITSLVTVTTCP